MHHLLIINMFIARLYIIIYVIVIIFLSIFDDKNHGLLKKVFAFK